jgi:hypothetical protein
VWTTRFKNGFTLLGKNAVFITNWILDFAGKVNFGRPNFIMNGSCKVGRLNLTVNDKNYGLDFLGFDVDVETYDNARWSMNRFRIIDSTEGEIERVLMDREKTIGREELGAISDVIVCEGGWKMSDGDINVTIPERTGTKCHGNGIKTFKKENKVPGVEEKKGKGHADCAHQGNGVYEEFVRETIGEFGLSSFLGAIVPVLPLELGGVECLTMTGN